MTAFIEVANPGPTHKACSERIERRFPSKGFKARATSRRGARFDPESGWAVPRRSMQVHHVVPHFHPEKGGVESNALGLARHLTGRGHRVVVHTSARATSGDLLPPAGTIDGIEIRRYRPSLRLGYYTPIFRPDGRGADIVHLHGYGFLTNDRTARSVRGAIPIVYSLHHGVAQPAPSLRAAWQRRIYDRWQGLATLRLSAAIVAPSAPARERGERGGGP